MNAQTKTINRKRKLINPKIQLRVVGIFLGMLLLAMTTQALLLAWSLAATANAMPVGGEHLLNLIVTTLGRTFLVTLGLVLPLVVYLGVLSTFKLVGPVYRFERHLEQVLRGERVAPCKIRKGDEFQGLCDLINEVTQPSHAATRAPQPEEVPAQTSQAA